MANSADNTVSVIDSSTNKVVGKPVPVGKQPQYIAFNPASGKLYVSNSADNTVSVIDHSTNQVVGKPIPVDGPRAIAINPANGKL